MPTAAQIASTQAKSDPLFGTFPSSTSNDDLINFLDQIWIRARDNRRQYYPKWRKNYRLLSLDEVRSGPFDSEIYPALSSLIGWMTDQAVTVKITPVANPAAGYFDWVSNLATELSAVLDSTWDAEDYVSQVKIVLWDSLIYGIGILKSTWDDTISSGYGNAVLRRVDPWQFYPDPNCSSMDDMEYCVEVEQLSVEELYRRFDQAKVNSALSHGMSDITDIEAQNVTSSMSRSMQSSFNLGALPGGQSGRWAYATGRQPSRFNNPGATIYTFWLRQNNGEVKNDYPDNPEQPSIRQDTHVQDSWRCIVMCNHEILFDEWAEDLWSHSQHPYSRYVFDDIGNFNGIAIVDHLAQPQEYINRLLGKLHKNADLIGDPILVESELGNTARSRIVNQPGQRLPVRGSMQTNKPQWLDPPNMPPFIMQLVQFWLSRIDNISGLSGVVKGQTPTARNAEGVIESIQEAAFVRVRASLRNLEKTLERAATKIMDLITDNYTDARIVQIVGPDGEDTAIALRARHFQVPTHFNGTPWKYSLKLEAGSDFPTSRQARIAEAMQLFTLGAIDDEELMRWLQIPGYRQIIERKYQKQAMGFGLPPGARVRAGRSG